MKKITALLTMIGSMGLSSVGLAQQGAVCHKTARGYEVDYGPRGLRVAGQNQMIPIRNTLSRVCGIDTNQYEIGSVLIFANSDHGKGKISLRVGQLLSQPQVAPKPSGHSLHKRMRFENPSHSSSGSWQFSFRGGFQVRKFVFLNNNFHESLCHETESELHLNIPGGVQGPGANSSTIFIKKFIKNNCPDISLANREIVGASLYANSRRGMTSARLRVGDNYSRYQELPRFSLRGQGNRVLFSNPTRGSQGAWQIQFDGQGALANKVVLEKKCPGYWNNQRNSLDDRWEREHFDDWNQDFAEGDFF